MEYNYIYDLDDKINLIYDYLYNINTKNCFIVDKIIPSNISIDDIKLKSDYDNKTDIEFYEKTKEEILSSGQYRFISYNNDLNYIIFKKYTQNFSINVKITFYKTVEKINDLNSLPNLDNLFSYLLSYLVLSKLTKHILLPIINLDCSFSDVLSLIKDTDVYNIINNLKLENHISDNVCIQVRESFFKNIDLEEYLKENRCELKILLFQIFHTLAIIQENYKGFSHNNLVLKNIIIYLKNKSSSYSEYNGFNNDKFYVYNNGFDIKITNFEKSYIPKLYGDKNNLNNDVFTIINDIINKFKHYCDEETNMFILKIYPPSLRESNTKQISISAKELLYNKYFNDFTKKPDITIVEETIVNHQYITGNKKKSKKSKKSYAILETFIDSDHKSTLGYQNKLYSHNIRIIKPYTNITDIVVLKRTIKKKNSYPTQKGGEQPFQKGGVQPSIINTKPEANSPFISNDQRKVNEIRAKENPIKEPPVLLEQKLYDVSQTRPPPRQQPLTIPLFDHDSRIANKYVPYSDLVNQPPIQKVYNLSFTNPLGSYTTLNKVFEDILPSDMMSFSMTTVYERLQTINYLRNNLISHHDGEDTNIKGGTDSLLSYIKIMDINPYSLKTNRLADLPMNFLLYRAAYPVKFDEKYKQISLSKSSMGINIRIYMLTHGDLEYYNMPNMDHEDYDIWREIKYYDWVKDNIIKRKVSPNFIAPILYKIDPKTNLDWIMIENKKKQNIPIDEKRLIIDNQKKINNKHNYLKKDMGFLYKLMPKLYTQQLYYKTHKPITTSNNDKIDITHDSGQMLILLTEASTHNIIQWASPIYNSFGSVKKMIATGYHSKEVWYSILFQLFYAFAVLHKECVYIENFSLQHNVYIKDIFSDLNNVGSWIYVINEIELYVPNYGFILMIDTKYNDINSNIPLLKQKEEKDKKYKIYGEIFKKNGEYTNMKDDIQKKIRKQFKDIINPDNFRYILKTNGGIIPDDEIIDMLTRAYRENENTDIVNIILNCFGRFLHNRVGTLLYKSEIENANLIGGAGISFNTNQHYKGNLVINDNNTSGQYEWVIYLYTDYVNGVQMHYFLTKKNGQLEQKNSGNLFSYPQVEKILPEAKKNLKYDELHIYETYYFDNIS